MLNPFRYSQPSLLDFPRYALSDPFVSMPSSTLSTADMMPDLRETDSSYQCAAPRPFRTPLTSLGLPGP
jgi:hypothetical protein